MFKVGKKTLEQCVKYIQSYERLQNDTLNFELIPPHFILLLILLNLNKHMSVGPEKWQFQTINCFQ